MCADNLICTRNSVKQTTYIWGKIIKTPVSDKRWLFICPGCDGQSKRKVSKEAQKGKACSF